MAEIVSDKNGKIVVYDPKTGRTTTQKSTGQITGTAKLVQPQQKASTAQLTAVDNAKNATSNNTYDHTANTATLTAIDNAKNATQSNTTKTTTSNKSSSSGSSNRSSNNETYEDYSGVGTVSSGSSGGGKTTTPSSTTTLNSLVDSLYASQDTAYQGMADSANASLKAAYDYNLQKQAAERDAALREAYIQGEMSKRNIAEQLSRQGIIGGAAESTLARLISDYQGARNEARENYASGAQELGNNYMTNANQNTNYYKQQAQTRKNTIYDTLLNYMLSNYGKTTQTGTTKSYTYDENGNVTGITETPQYSIDTDTAKKLAAIIGSLSA